MTDRRQNLLGMGESRLREFFSDMGEKPFRAQQVQKWVHQRGVTAFDDMTDLGKVLRQRLAESAVVQIPEVVDTFHSSDGCIKWIIRVASGSLVETVYIPEAGRGTLCISSQAGCSLDCSFCATGKQGFDSNLGADEIIGQLWIANAELRRETGAQRVITNVVMMGMGEPLLNFENVIEALSLMMSDYAYGLSKRKVTISTSGVVPAIRKLKFHTDASLAISLHAPNDALRSEIMPINRRYPIAELLEAVSDYMASLPDRRVPVIEYTLIRGVNDHKAHARELAELLADFPCKINLIPFNPFELSDYQAPSANVIGNFRQILQRAGYTVTVRTTRAEDIAAACGQLVGNVSDQTRRSERYRKRAAEGFNLVKPVKIVDSTGKSAPSAEKIL